MTATSFRPMLAAAVDDAAALRFPLLASPKFDGIRCVIRGGAALTRRLKSVPNRYVQTVLKSLPLSGCDGELIAGAAFNGTSSAIMSYDGSPKFVFYIFDDFSRPQKGFDIRYYVDLIERLKTVQSPHVALVEQVLIADVPMLERYEQQILAAGYEGVILRDPMAPYKFGRSTLKQQWLLKLKRFEDGEAVVLGSEEMVHNDNEAKRNDLGLIERSSRKAGKAKAGVLGKLRVRDLETDVEFKIGAGFTQALRAELWTQRKKIQGRVVKYKHQAFGQKDKPRLPVFLGFRDERDM